LPKQGSNFQYKPLDSTAKEIRLLNIEPGSVGVVHCSLSHVSLKEPPVYEALSYTWGDSKKQKDVILHGSSVAIIEELESTLRNLRHRDKERIVWIDALCIDQLSTQEKNSQVKLMRDIYANAKEVVIWLGDEFQGSNLGFDLLERLPQIDFDSEHQPLDYYMPDSWEPLAQLLNVKWWTRVWTIQELVMSASAVVCCGSRSVSFERFHHLAREVAKRIRSGAEASVAVKYLLTQAESNDLQILSQMRDMRQNGRVLPLAALLRTTATKHSTDSRDRVIALLGLADDTDRAAIEPDYAKSAAQLFRETTKHLISSLPYLDFLQSRELRLQQSEIVPSWCIDYAAPLNELRNRPPLQGFDPCPPKLGWSEDMSTMYIEGFDAGHIVYSSAYTPAPGAQSDFSNLGPPPVVKTWMAEMEKVDKVKSLHQTHDALLEAFSETLIAGQVLRATDLKPGIGVGSTRVLTSSEVRLAFDSWLRVPVATNAGPKIIEINDLSQVDLESVSIYRQCATRYLRGRAFVITSRGFLGLAAADVKVNDRTCFLTGAGTPVVLRCDGENYRWVGAAYVYSWMDGGLFEYLSQGHGTLKSFAIR
jgi:Heterokaryon incompatibility protein (HET)